MDNNNINIIINKYLTEKVEIELVIQSLKEFGLSQFQTTKVLVFHLKFSLKDADYLVINSKAWSKEYKEIIEFRKSLFDSIEEVLNTSKVIENNSDKK